MNLMLQKEQFLSSQHEFFLLCISLTFFDKTFDEMNQNNFKTRGFLTKIYFQGPVGLCELHRGLEVLFSLGASVGDGGGLDPK